MDVLDDRTVAYVVAAQPLFEDLRQVAAQLAGLLVLAATGSSDSSPDHPMLALSKQVLTRAGDGVRQAGTLATERARPHHARLVDARLALDRALTSAEAWPLDIDTVLPPLRDAYACLQQAAGELPGFQMIAFDLGCCGRQDAARPAQPPV
jgi:hypothetical protein